MVSVNTTLDFVKGLIKRGLKSLHNLICQIEPVETDIDYQ